MANRIPLVVVSNEAIIKELPAIDDLDLGNSSLQNANIIYANGLSSTSGSPLNISTPAGSNANIIISQNGSEEIRITNTGVGIFTSTPNSNLSVVGNVWVTSGINVATVNAISAKFGGTTTLQQILETANISATAMGANANVDVLECAVVFYTANSTANTTLNIRGNSAVTLNSVMSTNQSLTIAFVVTNGASAFRVGDVQLDGANTAVKWTSGVAPSGSANSVEAYSFTVIKTGAAAQYTLLGSKTQFA